MSCNLNKFQLQVARFLENLNNYVTIESGKYVSNPFGIGVWSAGRIVTRTVS